MKVKLDGNLIPRLNTKSSQRNFQHELQLILQLTDLCFMEAVIDLNNVQQARSICRPTWS